MRVRLRTAGSDGAENGFTLLEAMVAMGLLAFGLLGVTAALIGAFQVTSRSRYLTDAAQLARERMEIFQQVPLASLPATGTYDDPDNPIPHPAADDHTTFARRWIVAADSPSAGVTTIRVEVDWVDQLGVTRTMSLESMRGM